MDKDILKFDTLIAYLSVIGSLILITGLIFWSIKLLQIPYEKSYDRPSFHLLIWIISCSTIPILFIATCINIKNIIQIKMVPQLYLNNNYKDKK